MDDGRNTIHRISIRPRFRASARPKTDSLRSAWWRHLTWSEYYYYYLAGKAQQKFPIIIVSQILILNISNFISGARRAENISIKVKSSTLVKKMSKMRITWAFASIDSTSRWTKELYINKSTRFYHFIKHFHLVHSMFVWDFLQNGPPKHRLCGWSGRYS